MTFSCRFCCPLLLASLGLAGCSTPTAEVSGTITIKGKPPNLKGLEIGFLDRNGRLVTAPINRDGTYKAVGVPSGEAMVSLIYVPSSQEPTPSQGKRRLTRPDVQGSSLPKGPSKEMLKNPIPQHLSDGSTSKLSFKVVPGPNNVFNYDVQP
jgi:hypothetical protein